MAVTKNEIERLAWLAKLKFTDEELDELTKDMAEIIAFADTVNGSVEGLPEGASSRVTEYASLREDIVVESLKNEEITSNIEAENGFFPVRRRSL